MDTNHIAQVLQDKKLQKHLNAKINRQFKTCRYIGDIVIGEDEYILLKAYLHSICKKYLNTSERYITSSIFAVALVQIGIHKYDGRFWPHVEREIGMELPGSYQKWIGRSFYKTLEKYNKYKVAENEMMNNCGYSEVDENQFTGIKKKKHKISSGYPCSNEHLRLFSLGYRFLTDVVRIRFDNYVIEDWEHGLSILYGFLRGACSYLNIEENDISGCLQYEPVDGRPNYSIVVFDNTPGGAGHAKRLDNEIALYNILTHTLKMMKGCVCGGEVGDSSCYSCLRSYKNQKYHDLLKRKYVIEFVEQILDERM